MAAAAATASEVNTGWTRGSVMAVTVIAAVAISTTTSFLSAFIYRRRSKYLESRLRNLEAFLAHSVEQAAAERRGRVRAQQALRNAVVGNGLNSPKLLPPAGSYPVVPIGTVQSCFSCRYGTPRQPLLVPLARACLLFDPRRVSEDSLEGLVDFSHCWIIYVFHLNTNLDKMWREPSRSKIKTKVRVPRLKGKQVGVLATRSPHRPCPIGLTVAKVEAVDGRVVFLSGVDLVDGTPILDIKPYMPYSDCVKNAMVPDWVKEDGALCVASVCFSDDFTSSLLSIWSRIEKFSMYSSIDEFQGLIREVLSWDIRSVKQRDQLDFLKMEKVKEGDDTTMWLSEDDGHKDACEPSSDTSTSNKPTYHLVLEGIDISYRIDFDSNIIVEKAGLLFEPSDSNKCKNSSIWRVQRSHVVETGLMALGL